MIANASDIFHCSRTPLLPKARVVAVLMMNEASAVWDGTYYDSTKAREPRENQIG
jgi:hypothetical protein